MKEGRYLVGSQDRRIALFQRLLVLLDCSVKETVNIDLILRLSPPVVERSDRHQEKQRKGGGTAMNQRRPEACSTSHRHNKSPTMLLNTRSLVCLSVGGVGVEKIIKKRSEMVARQRRPVETREGR